MKAEQVADDKKINHVAYEQSIAPNANIPSYLAQKLGNATLNATPPRELSGEQMKESERARQQNLGRSAIQAYQAIPAVLPLSAFDTPKLRKLYSHEEIEADQRYVTETEEAIREAEKHSGRESSGRTEQQARTFEGMFLYGVQRNNWLGNLAGPDGKIPFTTDTSGATEYDDYKHRIDAFTTMQFTMPASDPAEQASVIRTTMGFDVSISRNRDTVMGKLTRCHNDTQAKLPFGFSQIKYCVRGNSVSKQPLVPRYVIGVSGQQVEELAAETQFTKVNGRLVNARFNPAQSVLTRFMVLSEICAQNQLYLAMLPDQPENQTVKRARISLRRINKQMANALDRCVDQMDGWLPKDLPHKLSSERTPEERREARQLVTEAVLNYCRQQDEKRTLESGFSPNSKFQDPFVQIMDCTADLTKAAQAGKLDKHRVIATHNRKFNVE